MKHAEGQMHKKKHLLAKKNLLKKYMTIWEKNTCYTYDRKKTNALTILKAITK